MENKAKIALNDSWHVGLGHRAELGGMADILRYALGMVILLAFVCLGLLGGLRY